MKKLVLIALITILLFASSQVMASSALTHPQFSVTAGNNTRFHEYDFGTIKINNNAELQKFVKKYHFRGSGTPSDPYVISHIVPETLILENISAHLIIEDSLIGLGSYTWHLKVINTSNLELKRINGPWGWTLFDHDFNITLSNFYQCESNVIISNSTNMIISNMPSGLYFTFNHVKNVQINNSNTSMFFENSQYISISNTTYRNYWDWTIDLWNCTYATITNSSLESDGLFEWKDSSHIWLKNLIIKGIEIDDTLVEFSGEKKVERDIHLENVHIQGEMDMSNIQNLTIKNVSIQRSECVGCYIVAINKAFNITLDNLYISGELLYFYGTKIKNSKNVIIKNSKFEDSIYGMNLKDTKDVIIENSTFENIKKDGILIQNSSNIKIIGNNFVWKVPNPIKLNGTVSYLILQKNARGVRAYPLVFNIVLAVFLIILLISAGPYKKRRDYRREATLEYYRKIGKIK